MSFAIGPPNDGLICQSKAVPAIEMSGKPLGWIAFIASVRLSDCSALPWPYRKNEPENRLPPSLGTLFTRIPLLWISADSEPVL